MLLNKEDVSGISQQNKIFILHTMRLHFGLPYNDNDKSYAIHILLSIIIIMNRFQGFFN